MDDLSGKRVLVVEDEFLVAATAADILEGQGATVVGPAATLAEAISLAGSEEIDGAMLDVNLNGERIDGVAKILRDRNVPFVFTTGYGEHAFKTPQDEPILDKPYTDNQLISALNLVMGFC